MDVVDAHLGILGFKPDDAPAAHQSCHPQDHFLHRSRMTTYTKSRVSSPWLQVKSSIFLTLWLSLIYPTFPTTHSAEVKQIQITKPSDMRHTFQAFNRTHPLQRVSWRVAHQISKTPNLICVIMEAILLQIIHDFFA
jgi:hypothetical protein